MDRFALFRTMSIRAIVAWCFAATILSTALVFGIAAWLSSRAVAQDPTGMPMEVFWAVLVAAVALALLAWLCADRLIVARLNDHRSLPARPEFYDFQTHDQPMHWDEIGGASLRDLRYVVFDTETTGLRPSQGDEIISIAALRIENGELDEPGAFSRLVNPARAIPAASIRFHGITDDMVADEQRIDRVLPAFRDFVGDAILIAHNAAFDMKFLQLKEPQTGIEISNLVLDTLLISVFLDHGSQDHSLDALAKRLGISIEGRHTALGDSVATARIFLKLIGRLESRGIVTLRQLVEACSSIEQVRKMRDRF
jgi:DNA polymerase III subunit epsilon